MAKGFKGRYFSLAAIVATVSCVNLQATENRVQNHERQIVQHADQELDDETASLEEVIVDAALPSSSSLKHITSDVTLITSEELQSRHYRDVLDALRHHVGFFVTQNGGPGQSSGFFLGGMSSEHILVMIDGIRLNDPTSTKGQAALEHIRLADVDHIEVIKGAQSGVWGADASGGVINIVTKEASKGLHVDAKLEGGSYTTQNGTLSASYANDMYALQAGFDGYKTDGFPPKSDSAFDAGDMERTYFASAKLRPKEGTNLSGHYRRVVSDFDFEGLNATTWKPEKQHGSADLTFYDAKLEQNFHGIFLSVYGRRSDFERRYNGNEYDGSEFEGGVKAHYNVGGGAYDLGISHRKSKMEKSYGKDVDSDIRDNAIFGAFTLSTLQDRLIVNAALRYDDYDAYDDKTTGKLGFKYRIWKEIAARANVGLGYRAPSLYERFGGDGYTLPNEDLKPESTMTYDVSLFGYGASIGYFYNEITDMIDYVFGANYGPGHYVNVEGTSKIQGVRFAYDRPVDVIDSAFGLSYEYVDAKDAQDHRLIRRPRHRAVARWDWFITDALDFDLNVNYAADYLDDDYSAYPAKRVQMGEYIVWNAVLNYQTDAGGFYVKVDNIFNEEYQVVKGYNTPETSVYVGMKLHY